MKQKYNPDFKPEGEDCANCPLPTRMLADIMEVGCGYAENMKAAGLKALEVAAEVEADSPFSEKGSPERAALKAKVDGPWGAGDEHQKDLGGARLTIEDFKSPQPLLPAPGVGIQISDGLRIDVVSGRFGDLPPEFRESLTSALSDLFKEPEGAARGDDEPVSGVNKRIVEELLALVTSPSPEGFMRDRLKQSLDEVKTLMERSIMRAKSFGWSHVEIELVNVCDFLGRASSALSAVVIKDANKS